MPTLWSAVGVLLLRFSISQMDVPTRQSFVMAVVPLRACTDRRTVLHRRRAEERVRPDPVSIVRRGSAGERTWQTTAKDRSARAVHGVVAVFVGRSSTVSSNRIVSDPSRMLVPSVSATVPWMRSPATQVPFLLPRSSIDASRPATVSLA